LEGGLEALQEWRFRLSPAVFCICIWFEHKREMNPVAERRRVCSNLAQTASASSRQLPPAGARIERTVEGEVGTRARTGLGRAARAAGDPCGRRRAGGREGGGRPPELRGARRRPTSCGRRRMLPAPWICIARPSSEEPAADEGGKHRRKRSRPPRLPVCRRRPGYAPPVAAEGGGGASRRPPPESLRSRGLVRICAASAWKRRSRAREEEEAATIGGRAEGRGAGTRETR
jgi:hypothetical protein